MLKMGQKREKNLAFENECSRFVRYHLSSCAHKVSDPSFLNTVQLSLLQTLVVVFCIGASACDDDRWAVSVSGEAVGQQCWLPLRQVTSVLWNVPHSRHCGNL